jgi:hypothetical protein
MQVEPLVSLLVNANLGVAGQTIFIDYMSENINSGILLLSSLAGNTIDYELPGWRWHDSFQAIIRSPDRAAGMALAIQVKNALTILQDTVVSAPSGQSYSLRYLRPIHDPIVYPRQLGGVWEISINFNACYVVLS